MCFIHVCYVQLENLALMLAVVEEEDAEEVDFLAEEGAMVIVSEKEKITFKAIEESIMIETTEMKVNSEVERLPMVMSHL